MRAALRRSPWTLALLVTLSAATPGAAECDRTRYGAGVTLDETTPIGTVLDRPEEFVGRTIRIEGTVTEVCAMAGCWLELRAADGERVLKVKVDDGEMVFPTSARGRRALAQGRVERLEMDRAQYLRWARHAAEEKRRPFDESAVGEGPFRVYQLRGEGAEICAEAAAAS
jgi:hypothetical protein